MTALAGGGGGGGGYIVEKRMFLANVAVSSLMGSGVALCLRSSVCLLTPRDVELFSLRRSI